MTGLINIEVTVNDQPCRGSAEARVTLADFLRDELRLTGTHVGCEHGACGACTVLLDGTAVRSCLLLAVQAQGAHVTTIEGVADGDELHPVQQALQDCHAFQCGFCTPGFVMTACSLLCEVPNPTELQVRETLAGNLCRCSGYEPIVDGVLRAAQLLRTEEQR